MVALVAPVNWIVLVPAVNIPLLIQFPKIVCVKVAASKVVAPDIFKILLTVIPAPAVFIFPLERISLL